MGLGSQSRTAVTAPGQGAAQLPRARRACLRDRECLGSRYAAGVLRDNLTAQSAMRSDPSRRFDLHVKCHVLHAAASLVRRERSAFGWHWRTLHMCREKGWRQQSYVILLPGALIMCTIRTHYTAQNSKSTPNIYYYSKLLLRLK